MRDSLQKAYRRFCLRARKPYGLRLRPWWVSSSILCGIELMLPLLTQFTYVFFASPNMTLSIKPEVHNVLQR